MKPSTLNALWVVVLLSLGRAEAADWTDSLALIFNDGQSTTNSFSEPGGRARIVLLVRKGSLGVFAERWLLETAAILNGARRQRRVGGRARGCALP